MVGKVDDDDDDQKDFQANRIALLG